jgi:hypothetical protein
MSALFETDSGSAKRKETGSRFVLNTTPEEFAKYKAFYENPVYDLNIGLLTIFISEVFALKSTYGHVVQQPVNTGVILEGGRLKADIEQKLCSRIPASAVQALINDLYELMVEFFISAFTGIYDLRAAGIKIHIYEAETRSFHYGLRTISQQTRPGPETIESLQAVRVF